MLLRHVLAGGHTADTRRFLLLHLEVTARLPTIRRVRRRAQEAWDLHRPGRLLDVGSGAGEVVRELAALVGPAGEVVGVDSSQAALMSVLDRAVLQGPLLKLGETAEPWLAEVNRAVAGGTLLAVLTIWVVTGTNPAG